MASIKKYTTKEVDLTMIDERELFGDDEEITKAIDILSDEIYKLSSRDKDESRRCAIAWMLGLIAKDNAYEILNCCSLSNYYRVKNIILKNMSETDACSRKDLIRQKYYRENRTIEDARDW